MFLLSFLTSDELPDLSFCQARSVNHTPISHNFSPDHFSSLEEPVINLLPLMSIFIFLPAM